jgi:rhodanese-related sulfurtransferase
MTTNAISPEDLIMAAYPIFKGEMETEYGSIRFGRMWDKWELDFFTKECNNIDIIWNLLEDPHGNIGPAKELHSPIDDFGTPADSKAFCSDVNTIITALKAGKKIFVHCHSGKGRTAIALALVLIHLGKEGNDTLSLVKKLTLGPETNEQCKFVLDISNALS